MMSDTKFTKEFIEEQKSYWNKDFVDSLAALEAIKHYVSALDEIKRIQDIQNRYPRAFKLMDKGKYFVVVAFDEPYFPKVYSMIRNQEKLIGRWNEEDEKMYQFFQRDDE